MTADLVIANGNVVKPDGAALADVLVKDGRILDIVDPGSGRGERVIDAHDRIVLPGGIDPHLHFLIAFMGQRSVYDFYSGTVAALRGGVTTVIDFAIQTKGRSTLEGLDAWHAKADGKAVIDYAFHMIVRELNGDVYFGEKGMRKTADGLREGYDIMSYNEAEVRRIAHSGFQTARARKNKLCSVDKANVLETSQLWRDVVIEVAAEYPDVALSHMYVDNAAMQLVRNPGQFDVIVTGNLFGDILSDQASMCAGSIGMLPSASLDANGKGLYEPIHGSAPDIAGQGKANPLATILSAAMMLRYSIGLAAEADRIEAAVAAALASGARTADLGGALSTTAMADAVLAAL